MCCAKLLLSCTTLCDPMDCILPGFPVCGNSPGKNTRVDCHVLLGIFPTQGSNLRLLHQQMGSLPLAPPGNLKAIQVCWKWRDIYKLQNELSLVMLTWQNLVCLHGLYPLEIVLKCKMRELRVKLRKWRTEGNRTLAVNQKLWCMKKWLSCK